MKYDIEITETAQRDFENIYFYISEKLYNKQSALRIIASIDEHIKTLRDMPEGFPLVNDVYLRNKGIRFIPVENYIVFYNVDAEKHRVYIVRVIYGKRNWNDILRNGM